LKQCLSVQHDSNPPYIMKDKGWWSWGRSAK
jgi:hypothetical protein